MLQASTTDEEINPAATPQSCKLPEGWKEYKITQQQVDARQNVGRAVGTSYYHNAETNKTEWALDTVAKSAVVSAEACTSVGGTSVQLQVFGFCQM